MQLTEMEGDWALVTGASSGIGVAYCKHLASAGINLVMVARRKKRMDVLAKELSSIHGTRTLVIQKDLSRFRSAQDVFNKVEEEGIRIRLLINNAAYGPWGSFEKIDSGNYEKVVQLNAATPIAFCRLFLSHLKSFPGSVVVNLSSPAALQPMPFKAVYAAAKACLHNFSLALNAEWKQYGIVVQALVPGPTQSELDEKGGAYKCKLSEIRYPPDGVVETSLANLSNKMPIVTNAKGVYKQRVFAGVFPVNTILRVVKDMFQPSLNACSTSNAEPL